MGLESRKNQLQLLRLVSRLWSPARCWSRLIFPVSRIDQIYNLTSNDPESERLFEKAL